MGKLLRFMMPLIAYAVAYVAYLMIAQHVFGLNADHRPGVILGAMGASFLFAMIVTFAVEASL